METSSLAFILSSGLVALSYFFIAKAVSYLLVSVVLLKRYPHYFLRFCSPKAKSIILYRIRLAFSLMFFFIG